MEHPAETGPAAVVEVVGEADDEDEDWATGLEEDAGTEVDYSAAAAATEEPSADAAGLGDDDDDDWDAGLEDDAAPDTPATPAKEMMSPVVAASPSAGASSGRGLSGFSTGEGMVSPIATLVRPSTLLEAARLSSMDVVLRSPCAAVTGLGDAFVSIDDLVLGARPGIRPDVAGVPVFAESGTLLNNYAVDFFLSKNRTALHERNLLDDQIIYTLVENFGIILRRISFALRLVVQAERACKHAADSPGDERLALLELLDKQYRELGQRYWDRFKRYVDKDTMWIKQHDRDL